MKSRLFKLVLLSVGFTSTMGWSQDKSAFSLSEAKSYALEHNPTIMNSELDIELSVAKKREVLGIGLPQVSFEGAFNHFINLPVQVVGANFINPNASPDETISFKAGTDFTSNGTLQASQLLFNGSYIVGVQVAKLYVDFQKTLQIQSKEDVLFNVIQSYQIATVAKENISFADSMLTLTQEMVDKQKNFLDLGMMKQDDYDQLTYSLLSAQNAKIEAENQYKNSLTLLKMTMGFPIDQTIDITEGSASMMLKSNVTSTNLDGNINMRILEEQMLLNTYNLKNIKASKLPVLAAFFSQQYNAYRNEFNFFANEKWFPSTVWGLQLNIPIYSGGQIDAQTKQAEIEIRKNENSMMLLKENLKFQEAQSLTSLENAKLKLKLQEANVTLAKKIYDNSIIRKEIGQESSINVTQKYNQLIMAQAQYSGAKIEVLNAKLELEKLYNQILTK